MIKLILGVVLLILILITSYYILVEKESFQNKNNENRKCGEGNKYEFSEIHNSLKYENDYMIDYINQSCFDEFLKNSNKFYENYKKNLNSYYKPLKYKEFHKKMAEAVFNSRRPNAHETGNLIPVKADKSHCALYTNDCSLSKENPDDYLNESSYINENISQLAMCHSDENCKLQHEMIRVCKNPCNKVVGLNEKCEGNGCSQSNNKNQIDEIIEKKDIYQCYMKTNRSDCESDPSCRFVDDGFMKYCESACYNLNDEDCNSAEQCYLSSSGLCDERRCSLGQEESFPTGVTNAVSNLDLRTHYCNKTCYVNESYKDGCGSYDINSCSNQAPRCSVISKFNVPKCVANNVN